MGLLVSIWGFHSDTQHMVHTHLKEEEKGDAAKGKGGLGVSNDFFFSFQNSLILLVGKICSIASFLQNISKIACG